MDYYRGYKIHKNYRMVTVWTFEKKSHQLVSTSTHTPLKGRTLEQRKAIIAEKLEEYEVHKDNPWVAVTDFLPPNNNFMVRFIREGIIYRGWFLWADGDKKHPYFVGEGGSCRFWVRKKMTIGDRITHWMPDPNPELPQP